MGKRAKKKEGGAAVGDKPFVYVQLRTFCHATEDLTMVETALANAAGFDLDDEEEQKRFRQTLTTTRSSGHFNNPIEILEVEMRRSREMRRFWDRLFAEGTVARRLLREADERLDDDLVFWFRIDKQEAAMGDVALSRGEDVVHVRAKVATYPKDREVALRFLEGFLGEVVGEGAAPAPA